VISPLLFVAGLSTTVYSWRGLAAQIGASTGGGLTITLGANFDCDYDAQITIPQFTKITIEGNGAVLDAAQQGRFFYLSSGSTLTLYSLTLQHGHYNGDGGAISNGAYSSPGGTLNVDNIVFNQNTAAGGGGGAIFNFGGTVVVYTAYFSRNQANPRAGGEAVYGGAICNDGILSIVDTNGGASFDSNSASSGGSIFVNQGYTATISGGTSFQNNSANDSGGAIYMFNSTVTVDGSTVFMQ
jgi:predicted outer membrane repeat protein